MTNKYRLTITLDPRIEQMLYSLRSDRKFARMSLGQVARFLMEEGMNSLESASVSLDESGAQNADEITA